MALSRDVRTEHRRLRALLVVGFLVLAWAIAAARATPANSYEVSIYAATTDVFWVGVGVALLVGVIAVAYGGYGPVSTLGLLLSGTAVVAVGALPVIRGYHFHGLADSLTHLGWTRSMAAGGMSAFDLIYPGGHLQSILIGSVGGVALTRAMMLVVVGYLVVYFVFIPLTVRLLISDPVAVAMAAFSGFLLLPINLISTHRMFHTFTLAMLLFPVILFLLFKHATADPGRDGPTSAAGLVLPIVTATVLFVHPQTAMNVIIFLGTISAFQFAIRRFRPDHRLSRTRAIYGQTAFLVVLFFAWSLQFMQTFNFMDGLVASVVSTVLGTGAVGAVVNQQTQNAPDVGVSIVELFLKLFLVSAIYFLLAAGIVVAKLFDTLRPEHPSNRVAISYFTVSGLTLGPFFLMHYLGDVSNFFFRHLGFAAVIATLLGVSALHAMWGRLGQTGRSLARPAAVVAIVVLLVLSLVVFYPSPYVYKRGHHASEQLMVGYEETFAHEPDVPGDSDEAVWYLSTESGPGRFLDAHGVEGIEWGGRVDQASLRAGLPAEVSNRSDGVDGRGFYLPISKMNRDKEVVAYNGFRYPAESFDAIDDQPGVNRVRSNGGFTLYYVESSTDASS